jgi:hypothetical protein
MQLATQPAPLYPNSPTLTPEKASWSWCLSIIYSVSLSFESRHQDTQADSNNILVDNRHSGEQGHMTPNYLDRRRGLRHSLQAARLCCVQIVCQPMSHYQVMNGPGRADWWRSSLYSTCTLQSSLLLAMAKKSISIPSSIYMPWQ